MLGHVKPSPPSNVMITSAIPVIAVSDSARAEDYYCRVLGFTKMFAYPPDATKPDPRYLGLARDCVWLHLQSYKPQRAGMTDAFFWVTDVDRLYEELSARGAVVRYLRPIKPGEFARWAFAIRTEMCSALPLNQRNRMWPNNNCMQRTRRLRCVSMLDGYRRRVADAHRWR